MLKILTLVILVACTQTQAQAQPAPRCMSHEKMLKLLQDRFDERVVAQGVTSTGYLIEVLSGPDTTNTWSIITTSPRGITCLIGAGDGWKQLTPSPPEQDT